MQTLNGGGGGGGSGEKANLMEGALQESRKRDTQSFPNM